MIGEAIPVPMLRLATGRICKSGSQIVEKQTSSDFRPELPEARLETAVDAAYLAPLAAPRIHFVHANRYRTKRCLWTGRYATEW